MLFALEQPKATAKDGKLAQNQIAIRELYLESILKRARLRRAGDDVAVSLEQKIAAEGSLAVQLVSPLLELEASLIAPH